MSRAKSAYWVQTKHGPWGPLDWKLLRNWLALGWLPPDIQVSEKSEGDWQPASEVEKFWVKTKGTADELHAFETAVLIVNKNTAVART